MRDFFLAYSGIVITVVTILNLVICGLLIYSSVKNKKIMPLCMGLIAFGLFYDGLIISLGNKLSGNPGLLTGLSQVRYLCHGLFVPLIFPICAFALFKTKKLISIGWIIGVVLIALGIASGIATELELSTIAGVTRYTFAESTPAWANGITYLLSFGCVIPLIITGVIVWKKQKTPFLFLSGFLMFLFSALPPATGNTDLIFSISMLGEVSMVFFMLLYQRVWLKNADTNT